MNNNTIYEKELSFQADRRKAGVEFIKIVSDLWYDKPIDRSKRKRYYQLT